MKIVPCTQGDMEWFYARTGRVTASDVAKVLSFQKRGEKKGEPTEAREGYLYSIIGEIATGEPDMDIGGYATGPMNWGVQEEGKARMVYEVISEVEVQTVGFVIHPLIDRAGASPDGLVMTDGCLEIKCPKSKTHVRFLRTDELPTEYEPQVMFELACTEREWCDFVSYDSRTKRPWRMKVKRVYRDEKRIAEINAEVLRFLDEADGVIAELERLYPSDELERSPLPSALKEQLRKSVEIDPNLADPDQIITDADLPPWAREMMNRG